ncbi:YqaJ domain-containing protein [Aphis craccivora]|uniref:YqaJ domain-containing protein n=1 Tax=Aphis craccivora TaxID=307492 RepID=A0A6G0Y3U7_APHCR|nr:YqaJ domain-containing protein [Aphis craccivora]
MGNKKNNVKRVTKKRLTRILVNFRKNKDNERCAKIQDEFIDSHELTVSSVSEVEKSLIERAGEINGCRIVDIGYVFSQVLDCTHEGMYGCNFMNMEYISEFRRVGIGYTQLAEFSAGLEIPYMSAKMYHSFQSVLQDDIKGSAWSEMKAAGDEERKYAIESGSVDNNGISLITVVADAQNRYCVICERASNKNIEKPIHTCFLNWKHGATSIEADGVAEGFTKSFEMHGVKYSKLIGDGDSSVTKRLNEILPYGPSLRVEKIECRNHMLRNYSQKMSALTKRTEFPIAIRKKIADNLVRLRTDITKAIQYRKSKEKPLQQKILNNLVDNCKSNENDGIVKEINIIVSRLANNAKSLILDVDNNICEQFNSVINKFLGGKRINYTQRSSYNTRILAAVVSFNSSEYLRAVKKHITQTSPGKTAKSFLSQIIKKRSACQKRRQLSTKLKYKVKRPKASSKPDEHYGNADILDGMTLYDVNRTTVEETTRHQTESENWRAERMIRLTASNFGRVCKMRRNTSCKNIVHSILYLTFNNKSIQYGRDMEDEAKTKFEEKFGYKIKKCGLLIDVQIPYLAASPDGIIGDTAIVEIKCPYAAKDTENEIEAVSTGKLKYCSIKENKLVLSKNHIYYYQIQGQLHISQKEQCFFIIYTTNWMSVQIIKYDDDFWSTHMVDKLKT